MALTVKGEMAKRGISIKEIAEFLNIHRNSVANKLNGETPFSIEESFSIRDRYFPDWKVEDLFRNERGE